jgi:hypothetical protein
MNSKKILLLMAMVSSFGYANKETKFGNIDLKFGNEVIMNEIGGVSVDMPDQLEAIVKKYLGWKQQYAREFSHIPFNSPEAQTYRNKFLEQHPELKNKLKKEIPSAVRNPETLEKIKNYLIKSGWSSRDADEFVYIPLFSREARAYRRRFMKEHPNLRREGVTNARIPTVSVSQRPVSPGLAQRIQQLQQSEQQAIQQ